MSITAESTIKTKYTNTTVDVWCDGKHVFLQIEDGEDCQLAKLNFEQVSQLREALFKALVDLPE
jgi:hypothetical protein